MSLKSIIAVASGEAEDAAVIGLSGALAARFGAHVRVTPAFPDPAADLAYYGSTLRRGAAEKVAAGIAASERAAQERLESLARDVVAQQRLPAGAICVDKRDLQPAIALASASVLADVLVFGAAAARSAALGGLFAEALLALRAPCLLASSDRLVFGTAAVAWDGSTQAGRALRAALPLLGAASKVIVLHNADDVGGHADPADLDDVKSYLAQHGAADVSVRIVRGENVAATLLSAAKAEGCELLVAGAYGRARLFEWMLGGTTRALVHAHEGPHILLAH
jgi:nucleotide-binding universal stress UspA family protein